MSNPGVSLLLARITIGGELWAQIEWSEKEQKWCIEDAVTVCIKHIYGTADDRDVAIALAHEMIRDGRMPSPEQARSRDRITYAARRLGLTPEQAAEREAQLEKRRNQPANVRRRQQRKELDDLASTLSRVDFTTRWRAEEQLPWYETIASLWDFSDPDLWQSNAFASVRPVLVIYLEAVVIDLEGDLVRGQRRKESTARVRERLSRARQILQHLLGPDGDASTAAIGKRAEAWFAGKNFGRAKEEAAE